MELEKLLNELKNGVAVIESLISKSDTLSGAEFAKDYVKENELEYISDEIFKAFKAGFLCCLRQVKTGKICKEDA